MAKPKSYQKALEELEQIIAELQVPAADIDALQTKAKRAAELLQFCQSRLRNAEAAINDLFKE